MSGTDVNNPSLDEQLHAFGVVRGQLADLGQRHTTIMAKVGEIEAEIDAALERLEELRDDIIQRIDRGRAAL